MKHKPALLLISLVFISALYGDEKAHRPIETQLLPVMPKAVSNNAVALLPGEEGFSIYSFLGLESGKTWADASRAAMRYTAGSNATTGTWEMLEPVPGEHGRLAASAITAGGEIYLFGGYTVASDHSEESTREVYRVDRGSGKMSVFTTMPVPVEDSVLAVYQDRWIYLISGWHDLGNVNLVQVLDTQDGSWAQATPFPGSPVFGHAGGIAGNTLIVCDGVKIEYQASPGPRTFLPSDECWKGVLDAKNYRLIDWRPIDAHPGKPLYRMAATNAGDTGVWFAGGSDNPYNFNGVGYNGTPSKPESGVFRFNVSTDDWETIGKIEVATMDHRGLLHHDGWFYIVGGMRSGQIVTNEMMRFRP